MTISSTLSIGTSPLNPPESDLTRFTTWGNGFSVGRVVGEISSLPGKTLEAIGSSCRKVEWLPFKSTGFVIENIGSAMRTVGSLAGSIVTLLERVCMNIAKTLGGIGIATIGIFVAPFNTALFNLGAKWIKDAWAARENSQQDLSLNCPERERAVNLCKAHYTNIVDYKSLNTDVSKFISARIPQTWRSSYKFGHNNYYTGQINNILPVNIKFQWRNDGNVHIMFGGAGNLKAFASAITSLVGIEDETFRNARKLVQDFAAMNPGKVHVSGFSLGGALAQYAGISAGVPVTCFNSLALSPALIDKMVDWNGANLDKIKHAQVEHYNAKDDWVAQGLQSSYSLKWLNLNQLGARHIVPEAYSRNISSYNRYGYVMENDSHNSPHMYAALTNTIDE